VALRADSSRNKADSASLGHVVVCGGTTHEWFDCSANEWQRQLNVIVQSLEGSGVQWLTLCPWGGQFEGDQGEKVMEKVVSVTGGTKKGNRVSFIGHGGVVCIVDVCSDGRTRFVDAVNSLAHGADIDEGVLESALFSPALADPDLVLVFGPPTQLPPSLMWELAYSELVFLDTPWSQCNAEHVHMAIDDFQRRDRRFGGIDT